MKCRLSCDASWPQNRPLGTFGGPLQWRVSGKASIHYGRVYFHQPSVKPFRFVFFFWLFHGILLCFINYCCLSDLCIFFNFLSFVSFSAYGWIPMFTESYQQSLCRSAPGGSPKQNLPGSQRVRPRFSKHALTNRWMAQFPGAEGQEPKKGEGSWWKGSYT